MKQSNYEIIVKCVQVGAPVYLKDVLDDLNQTIKLAQAAELKPVQKEQIAEKAEKE